MLDDGMSGDGSAGDGVFGAPVPIVAHAGQRVQFYVAATATNAFASVTFSPALSENDPLTYTYSFGSAGVRITEVMYQGNGGEFVEFTNITNQPIDMTNWSMDDDSAAPGTFSLSGAGVLQPGQSCIVTELAPATFIGQWGLSGVAVLGPNTVSALGRNDAVNLFDASGNLVDRLRYGDESFPGTIRPRFNSAQTCLQNIGQDDIAAWELSALGDEYSSWASSLGDIGTPGDFPTIACCPGDANGDGSVDFGDLNLVLSNFGVAVPPGTMGDVDGSGTVDFADLNIVLSSFGNNC